MFQLVLELITAGLLIKASTQCIEGEVRLVNGSVPNEGRVEICIGFIWGTVCNNWWDDNDAMVVCRQLGYNIDDAQFKRGNFGQGIGPLLLASVHCYPNESSLLDCLSTYVPPSFNMSQNLSQHCPLGGGAGVNCSIDDRLKSISVTTTSTTVTDTACTVLITWEITGNDPWFYEAECFNDMHRVSSTVIVTVNNVTVHATNLEGLRPTTSYTCCVLAIYGYYEAKRICATIQTPSLLSSRTDHTISVVGGILGLIITILVILLAVCGIALVYLIRPRFLPNRSAAESSTDVAITRTVSYSSRPTTSGSQASQTARAALASGQNDTGAAAEYSRIGPSYENSESERQQSAAESEGNQVSARLSERYEYSEPHLPMISAASGGGSEPSEGGQPMDYEVPLQSGQREEYSHLQH